jgi:hypothetical protein
MKAMLRNVWRGSPVMLFLSNMSRMVKLPAVRTSRRLSTFIPSCCWPDAFATWLPPSPIVCRRYVRDR